MATAKFLDIQVLNYAIKSLSKQIDKTFLKKSVLFDVTPAYYRMFDPLTDDPSKMLTVVDNNSAVTTGEIKSDDVRVVSKNPTSVYTVGSQIIYVEEVLTPKFDNVIGISDTDLIAIKNDTADNRRATYQSNVLFVVDDSKLVFYNRDTDNFVVCSDVSESIPDWKDSTLYNVDDLVKYNNETFKCIAQHTSSSVFTDDATNWITVLNKYYALTQAQYDQLIANGVITDATKDIYIIIDANDKNNTIVIVDTLPTPSVDIESNVYFLQTDNHLYKCIEDPDNLGTYIMKDVTVSGGSAVLSSDLTSNVEVGGVPKNKTYAKDTPLETIVRDILNKYIEPTVVLAINPNKTVYKKGDTLNPLDIKATVTKNSNDIVSIKYYVDTTLVDTKDSSTDPTLPTGGTFTYQYTTDITTDSTIKVVVNDSTKDVTKTVKIIFVNPYYVGASATNVVTSTTGLTETVEDKGDKTINYVCNNEYAVFMYPSSYGNITTILDENGFNCTTDFALSTTTIDSVSYNVYVSNNQLTTSGFKYTFKL